MEVWKPVTSAPAYEVSDAGRVRSVDRLSRYRTRYGGSSLRVMKGRILKPWPDGNGYPVVYLCTEAKPRHAVNVHRLVAEAFLSRIDGKDFVNHKDGVKSNCEAENLEWCTRTENMAHAAETGLCRAARKVVAIRGGFEQTFTSVKDAAQWLGDLSKRGHIRAVLCGLKPTAYGYAWRYET